MTIDKSRQFHFSPLQSEFARNKLPANFTSDLKSVIYIDNENRMYSKSEAVLRILNDIGGLWKISIIGKFLPKKIMNGAYDMIAANRYKIFGKKETCRLPTPEERNRFITKDNLNPL
jgi:predicted DCC family thiol-disulfide oxidoreductase YuxK